MTPALNEFVQSPLKTIQASLTVGLILYADAMQPQSKGTSVPLA